MFLRDITEVSNLYHLRFLVQEHISSPYNRNTLGSGHLLHLTSEIRCQSQQFALRNLHCTTQSPIKHCLDQRRILSSRMILKLRPLSLLLTLYSRHNPLGNNRGFSVLPLRSSNLLTSSTLRTSTCLGCSDLYGLSFAPSAINLASSLSHHDLQGLELLFSC